MNKEIDYEEEDEFIEDEKLETEEESPRRKLHWFFRLARVLIVLAILWFVGLSIFIDIYGHWDQAQNAQAIVILGARVGRDRKPGDSLRARTLKAVALYKRGLAKKIICTGGLGDYPPTEAQAAAQLAQEQGVPPGDLRLETQSTSTLENVRYATEICRKEGWTHVITVSDPYHLWRVGRDFRAQGLTVYSSPASDCERNRRFSLRLQWTARESLAVTRDLLKDAWNRFFPGSAGILPAPG